MPYRLLVAAIARASALDIRRAAAGPLVEPCPAISRPNIHLLVFDRKRWEATPPLPQAQRAQGLAAQEFFFDYVPTSSVTSRIVQDAETAYTASIYLDRLPRQQSPSDLPETAL